MRIALLIDFGSTYTKVTAVDLDQDRFIGRAQAPSTVETDVTQGLLRALQLLKQQHDISDADVELRLACSSAAGGLRMVAIGLIGRLTAEAATRAVLGAGAKVVQVFERGLNSRTVAEMEEANPDIVLLAGGVDGGNTDVIVRNARWIARSTVNSPVVVAGNANAAAEVVAILQEAGHPTYDCANVMPQLNVLDVEPAREMVRDVFISHIVKAKGLERATEFVGSVVMPTPMAVLKMTELLSVGTEQETGLGDILVVDIGGATTDVHSTGTGEPVATSVPTVGLDEPFAKRTVEGDLGLRVSVKTLLEKSHENSVPQGITEVLERNESLLRAEYLSSNISVLPQAAVEWDMDDALAGAASFIAVERHSGHLKMASTDVGHTLVQFGKDLTETKGVIGTGGVFAFGRNPQAVLSACLYQDRNPYSLRPKHPDFFVDKNYILYAGGLLSTVYPEKALRLVKSSLRPVEAASGSPVTGNG